MRKRGIRTALASTLAAAALGLSLAGCSNSSATEAFYFQLNGLQTDRQGGTEVDIIVGLRYEEDTPAGQIPDYRPIAELAQGFLVPSADLPAQISWEALLRSMTPRIMEAGPFTGVTVQLRVHPECGGDATDLVRSAIYTVGDITPMEFEAVPGSACQSIRPSEEASS